MLRVFVAALIWAAAGLGVGDALADTESRVALVIGNGAYTHAHPLANPVNDANAMAATLRLLGFEVVSATDTDRVGMVRALGQFRKQMTADGVGLFYYAGHGMQVRGHNYLLPLDADIGDENDAALLAIDLETVENEMERAGVRLSLYVLDACRDDPFEQRFRGAGSRGLAPVDAARGSVIAFATAPGKTAADGNGEHGLFTGELLKTIVKPGLELEDVLKQTAARVESASGNQQTPWYNSAFHGHFFFSPVTANMAPSAPPADTQKEILFWESVKGSNDPADYEDFLKHFPSSQFASLAQRRVAALRAPPPAAAQSPAAVAPAIAIPAPPQPPDRSADEGEASWSIEKRREVQRALRALGHYQGQPDGGFGPGTRVAIAQFRDFAGIADIGPMTNAERKTLLHMSERLAALLDQPATSPQGADARSVKSGPQRYARAASFEPGKSAKSDPAEAAYWYALAAADNEARAFTNLGTLAARGQIVAGKPDLDAARLLWWAGAARSDAIAMYNLGVIYERGMGVMVDLKRARAWYDRAAARNHVDARAALKRLGM
jgi:TPR repeat protein